MLRLPVKRVTMVEKITRFGVSIEPDLLTKFDKIIKKEGYANRSEAIRDMIRRNLIEEKNKDPDAKAIVSSGYSTGPIMSDFMSI